MAADLKVNKEADYHLLKSNLKPHANATTRAWELAVWSGQSEIRSKWILPDVSLTCVSQENKPSGNEILKLKYTFSQYIIFADLLIEALFRPGHKVNPEHKFKYIFLLAYAVCVHETWQEVS